MSLNFIPRSYINGSGVALGRILLPDGSAAAPALSFASATSTGLYAVGTDIRFSGAGTNRMTLATNQLSLTPAALSGTSATSAFTLAQTWNTTGAPTLVDWTVTNTASDAASNVFRIKGGAAGTTELFRITAAGQTLLPDGSAAVPSLSFASDTDTGFYLGSGAIRAAVGAANPLYLNAINLGLTFNTLTGSQAFGAFTASQTWNTTGAPVFADWTITDTASDAASLAFRIRGGAAGTTELFKVSKAGAVTSPSSITGDEFVLSGYGSRLKDTADGIVRLTNTARTGLTTFSLGPVTGNSASGSTSITHVNATIDMATASGTGTGTITVPGFFTAGAKLIGFSAHVTTILAGASLTTWSAGTGGATTLLGTGLAIAAGTKLTASSYTGDIGATFYGGAAKDLVITAAAGVFSTGVLKVTATVVTTTAISA